MRVMDMDRATLSDVIEVLEGRSDGGVRTWARSEIVYDVQRREAYSYGRHFPLFRMIEAPGPRGRRARYVLNGERWRGARGWNGSRTDGHQSIVRDFLAGADTIILPFGALEGAGIDLDSIRTLDVAPDQWHDVTREVRTLAEAPRWRRTEDYRVKLEAPALADVPRHHQTTWRAYTDDELAARLLELELETAPSHMTHATLPLLPGADGMYRWTETRKRDMSPDPDGMFRWTEQVHSLGEAVFSAVRAETATRAARPFERASSSARRTVILQGQTAGGGWRDWCEQNEAREHEAGPGAACVHCGAVLRAQVTARRRARFLSGFDTNENPPLYFLCELPRGAGTTVEQTRESLAPRAVHAAMARGNEVRRQGDIFLVDTPLTRAELEARGATFARLTLWTRDAKPREGEPGYRAPVPADARWRKHRRERATARRMWHEAFEEWMARAVWDEARELRRHERREQARARWTAMEHELIVPLEGFGPDELAPCARCGAVAGAPCAPDNPDPRSSADGTCRYRPTVGQARANARGELRRTLERERDTFGYLEPSSSAQNRREDRTARARTANDLAAARDRLRRAVFASPKRRTDYRRRIPGSYGYATREATADEARNDLLAGIAHARANYDSELERYRLARLAGARVRARDESARRPRAAVALTLWDEALDRARAQHRPETVLDNGRWRERRERIRRACSIYGTAHTATELAHVRGATYARGVVRHVPELEPGRGGIPDHRPITLTADRWYLCLRNTVPRSRRADG